MQNAHVGMLPVVTDDSVLVRVVTLRDTVRLHEIRRRTDDSPQ